MKKTKKLLASLMLASILTVLMALPVFAASAAPGGAAGSDIWTQAALIMGDVYSKIVGISTIAAVVAIAVALLLRNFSKNGRVVEESTAWIKNIAIGWAIINALGWILNYVSGLFAGGAYTP